MNVAVAILNWNGVSLLQQFLPTVVKYSQEASVYVIDNASADASVSWIKEHCPCVKILLNDKNYGFAGGYNKGLAQIKADYYLLLNSDVEVRKDWLTPMMVLLNNDKNVAVVQPKIKHYKDKAYFEYAGAAGGFIDALGYPYCRGRVFQTIEKDESQYEATCKDLHWATGACMMVRSTVFKDLGGFDEDYFAYQEEIDFCWRVRNKGFKIAYAPQSEVYHVGGGTMDNTCPKKTCLNFRNSLYSLVKNLPKNELFTKIPIRLLLDGIAGIKFLFQGQINHTFAIFKAHISFYKNRRKMLTKRGTTAKVQQPYKVYSIVWRYFVLRKKHFNQ